MHFSGTWEGGWGGITVRHFCACCLCSLMTHTCASPNRTGHFLCYTKIHVCIKRPSLENSHKNFDHFGIFLRLVVVPSYGLVVFFLQFALDILQLNWIQKNYSFSLPPFLAWVKLPPLPLYPSAKDKVTTLAAEAEVINVIWVTYHKIWLCCWASCCWCCLWKFVIKWKFVNFKGLWR